MLKRHVNDRVEMPVGDDKLPTPDRSLKHTDCFKPDAELWTLAEVADFPENFRSQCTTPPTGTTHSIYQGGWQRSFLQGRRQGLFGEAAGGGSRINITYGSTNDQKIVVGRF